eukprot:5962732-Prymnesium_polylepis.1
MCRKKSTLKSRGAQFGPHGKSMIVEVDGGRSRSIEATCCRVGEAYLRGHCVIAKTGRVQLKLSAASNSRVGATLVKLAP